MKPMTTVSRTRFNTRKLSGSGPCTFIYTVIHSYLYICFQFPGGMFITNAFLLGPGAALRLFLLRQCCCPTTQLWTKWSFLRPLTSDVTRSNAYPTRCTTYKRNWFWELRRWPGRPLGKQTIAI